MCEARAAAGAMRDEFRLDLVRFGAALWNFKLDDGFSMDGLSLSYVNSFRIPQIKSCNLYRGFSPFAFIIGFYTCFNY